MFGKNYIIAAIVFVSIIFILSLVILYFTYNMSGLFSL